MAGDHLLVGGHDRFAGEERILDPPGGRLDAADRFDDAVDVAAEKILDGGRPGDSAIAGEALLFHRGATIADMCERDAADRIAAGQAARHGGADGSAADKTDLAE